MDISELDLLPMSPHIFCTGGTGLLGSFLIPRLLRAFSDARVTLLLRAASEREVQRRLEDFRLWVRRNEPVADSDRRIAAIGGDVLQENFGIPQPRLRRLLGETTHIIHGAATIRFDHPIAEARSINAGGTRRALELARQARGEGILQRFLYIGTSSVSGRREGVITEEELEMGQEFFNTYEQSKCESERLVRDAMSTVPATIVRPSIVVGDSRTGRTTTFNVVYIPLRLFHRGVLDALPGNPETLMDIVPVDWVDDVIVHLLREPAAEGTVCHLTAGPRRAVSLARFCSVASEYFDRVAPLSSPRRFSFLPMEEFQKRLDRWGNRAGAFRAQLERLMPYVTVNRLFDSRTTDALLDGSALVLPAFPDYAETIFEYCLKSRWGKIPL